MTAGTRRDPALLVGRLTGDFVRVRLAMPGSAAGEPAPAWARGVVEVSLGPFRASFEGTFALEAFARLRGGLAALEGAGGGAAQFDPLEPCLVFDVRANGRGAFVAEGTLHPMPARAHRLAFSIDLDAGDVREMARGLDRMLGGWRGSTPVDGPRT